MINHKNLRPWKFLAHFKILFSKISHSFQNFRKYSHSKITTYTVSISGLMITASYQIFFGQIKHLSGQTKFDQTTLHYQ